MAEGPRVTAAAPRLGASHVTVGRWTTSIWYRLLAGVLIVLAASAVRAVLFAGLGRGIPFLTYYPAVMLAALLGGLPSGLLATAVAASLCFLWIQNGVMSPVESLAMGVFLVSCTMISFICEATRRAQAQARLAQEQAEAANRAKSVFLANMSHELRTPLNAILGFSDLMSHDASVPSRHQRTLEIIHSSGEHLLSLINDVLDMAKIEAGRAAAEMAVFDLPALMRGIADLMRQRAEAKGLTLTLQLAEDLPRTVESDQRKLRQVVLNLVGNAVKFTSQGGVMLRVASRPVAEARSITLVVEVEDTGPGLSEDDRRRVFDPFVQVGDQADHRGTGLGLTITRQFVEVLGGAISIEGAVGKGSLFRVEAPVGLPDTTTSIPAGRPTMRLARLAPGQPPCRVLVVDDHEPNRQLMRQVLEEAGFEVEVSEDGAQGVEAFQSWRPHFIWMDRRMPVMDGLDAIRLIRTLEGGRDVKVAVLSASVSREEQADVMAAGADDFMAKPVQAGSIYGCMAKHLGVRLADCEPLGSEAVAAAVDMSLETIESLPVTLRSELADALVRLDADRIGEIVSRVREIDATLGDALRRHTCRLEYTTVLRSLQSCSDRTGEGPTV